MAKKILVVDDEQDIIKVLHVRLGAVGYEVISAENGLEGLEKAKREKPDLILLDVMMPCMHGFDALQRLKDNKKTTSIPVIMLTAKDDKGAISKAKALGAKDYLTKPFNSEALLDSIERCLA